MAACTLLLMGALFVRFWTATVTYSTDPTHQWVFRASPGFSKHLEDPAGPLIVMRSDENGMLGQGLYDAFVGGGWLVCAVFAIAAFVMCGLSSSREPTPG